MRILSGVGLVVWLAVATACGGQGEPESASQATPPVAEAGGLIEGTPPGGLEDWLADIEAGLPDTLAGMSGRYPRIERALLDLYVGRQEYIEMYWGPAGRLQAAGGESLGEAILRLETAFHELLQAFVSEPMDTVRVAGAVESVREHAASVRAAAPGSGLPLIPPGNPPVVKAPE